jgi:benzoyl-CoA reductase/2-hydroxyglutaryl-CoA dehydratase subunit BcrC/BadD/HgdB
MVSDRLDVVADDPIAEARSRAALEGRALGLGLSSYFPLEVFDAFGLAGVRMLPRPMDGYPQADGVLQAFACAPVRSMLETLLQADLPIGLVGSTSGCDAVTTVPGILNAAMPSLPVVSLRLPIAVESEAADRHATLALLDLCREAEAILGRPLDLGTLETAVIEREAVRVRVGDLFGRLPLRDIPASRAYAAAIAAQVMAPRAFLALCDAAFPADAAPTGTDGIPILLSGELVPSVQWIRDLESLGAAIVSDDTNTGTRDAGRRVRRDPPNRLKAIAESLMHRPVHSPERFVSGRPRGVAARAREAGVKAAILLHYKFCDPSAFEAPSLVAALKEVGIPSLVLEVDRQITMTGGDRTRVQTLLEALP